MNSRQRKYILFTMIICLFPISSALAQETKTVKVSRFTPKVAYRGFSKAELKQVGFTKQLRVDYRRKGNQEWITYKVGKYSIKKITFHLINGAVQGWKLK